jgi:cytochrome c oxidase subunit I+III
MAFTHIHLSMRLSVCPPPGAALPPLSSMLLVAGCFVVSSALYGLAGRGIGQRPLARWRLLPLGVALATVFAGTWFLISEMNASGLAPKSTGWAASIAVLLSYQGFHLAILLVMGAFLAARIGTGWTGPRQRATYDNTGLMWWGSCLQGVVVALLPHAMAWAMS